MEKAGGTAVEETRVLFFYVSYLYTEYTTSATTKVALSETDWHVTSPGANMGYCEGEAEWCG